MVAFRPPMYEPFADQYESHASDGAYNAHYDRPAVLELLGAVEGLRVLDVGCGPGLYAAELVSRGAVVTAFDASPTMVELARRRLASRAGVPAQVRLWDVEQPLTWLPAASQDAAVMALVLHHVDRRASALAEIHRVLRPGGRLVVSTTHPTSDWMVQGGGYFDRVQVEEVWRQSWHVRYWRQPLEAWCQEFTDAGFLIERLVEPRPAGTMAERYPDEHAKLQRTPGFIVFRLLKPDRDPGHR